MPADRYASGCLPGSVYRFCVTDFGALPGIGREVHGAQRWLPLGPLTLRPSEFAKLALLLYAAGYLIQQEEAVRHHWGGLVRLIGILSVVAFLLLLEPDFGTTVIVVGMVVGMTFLAGARLTYVLTLVLLVALAFVALVLTAPYRLQRLTLIKIPGLVVRFGFQLTNH